MSIELLIIILVILLVIFIVVLLIWEYRNHSGCNTDIPSKPAFVHRKGTGQVYQFIGEQNELILQVPSLALVDAKLAPNLVNETHVDYNADQFYRIEKGTYELKTFIGPGIKNAKSTDGLIHLNPDKDYKIETTTLNEGDLAYIPRGTVFQFRDVSGQGGELLVGFTPGERFNLVRDLSTYYNKNPTHPNQEQLMKIQQDYCTISSTKESSFEPTK